MGVADDFPTRKAHPALGVTGVGELERLADRLTSAGVTVRWDAALPGARRFYVEDPWGNRLELLAPTEREAGRRAGATSPRPPWS